MESQGNWQGDSWRNEFRRRKREGRMTFGLILVAVGAISLLHMFGIFPFAFGYHVGWPLILVVVGLVIGIRSNFRRNAWWILMLIGGVFMIQPFYPYIGDVPTRRLLWPGLLIIGGIAVLMRRRDDHWEKKWRPDRSINPVQAGTIITADTDTINIDAVFCGRKEVVTSRNFKGGIIRASFSGVELNMAGAEAGTTPMILEIHASFAGVELVIPSHWDLQNEIRPTLGNVEDQRMMRTVDAATERRVLVLRGTCNFGSIEIKSY